MDHCPPVYVAFYGTLRRGERGHQALGLESCGSMRWVGMCHVPGQLYHLGDYPGLVPGESKVAAELFALTGYDLLARLDEYEGYKHGDESHSLFVRRLVRLAEPNQECWVYYYNRPVGDAPLIVSGDWLG